MRNETSVLLPYRLTRRGAELLNMQCWLWGQDIKCPDGNLLLQAGMSRVRPPHGVTGCSQYSMRLSSGALLKLWGFGFYCGVKSGCYLNRFEFVPRAANPDDCWTGKAFERAPRTSDVGALPEALRWIASYEASVLERVGPKYRWAASAVGSSGSVSPIQLGTLWSQLARDVDQWARRRSGQSESYGTDLYLQTAH